MNRLWIVAAAAAGILTISLAMLWPNVDAISTFDDVNQSNHTDPFPGRDEWKKSSSQDVLAVQESKRVTREADSKGRSIPAKKIAQRKQAKVSAQRTQRRSAAMKQPSSNPAKRNLAQEFKPETDGAEALQAQPNIEKKTPWIEVLSGEKLVIGKDKSEPKERHGCEVRDCSEEDPALSLVGVVVATEHVQDANHELVEGRFEVGDAKRTPALYVK